MHGTEGKRIIWSEFTWPIVSTFLLRCHRFHHLLNFSAALALLQPLLLLGKDKGLVHLNIFLISMQKVFIAGLPPHWADNLAMWAWDHVRIFVDLMGSYGFLWMQKAAKDTLDLHLLHQPNRRQKCHRPPWCQETARTNVEYQADEKMASLVENSSNIFG